MRLLRRFLPVCLLSAGCFNPDVTNTVFRCTPEQPQCPAGQVCTDGFCRASSPGTDGAVSDAAGGSVDQQSSSGCADGRGTQVGTGRYACPGTFTKGQAASRCAPTWRLCANAQGIDVAACNLLAGFFVAEAPGSWGGSAQFSTCSTVMPGENGSFFGCGKVIPPYTFDAQMTCYGFKRSLDCYSAGSKWNCIVTGRGQTLAESVNNSATDGVLCCAP
ncbi:MAG: hypothetical protein U1A78_00175 [Polyangia bacterium]